MAKKNKKQNFIVTIEDGTLPYFFDLFYDIKTEAEAKRRFEEFPKLQIELEDWILAGRPLNWKPTGRSR